MLINYNPLLLGWMDRISFTKPFNLILRLILLLGISLPLSISAKGGTLTGVVYRQPSKIERPKVNRYKEKPLVSTQNFLPNYNQAIIYLTSKKYLVSKLPHVHPQMEQINKHFNPFLLSVTTGTTVDFPNNDPIFHNVFSYSKTKKFDLGRYRQGKYKSVTFNNSGLVRVFCEIHNDMRAYILVLDTPFHTVSNERGDYKIEQIPTGSYTLHVWQENLPNLEFEILIQEEDTLRIDIR